MWSGTLIIRVYEVPRRLQHRHVSAGRLGRREEDTAGFPDRAFPPQGDREKPRSQKRRLLGTTAVDFVDDFVA